MDPEIGKFLFALIMTFFIILIFSFIYLPSNSPSFTVAEIAFAFLVAVLILVIYDIRKEARGRISAFYVQVLSGFYFYDLYFTKNR